jgi:hypothetical protein
MPKVTASEGFIMSTITALLASDTTAHGKTKLRRPTVGEYPLRFLQCASFDEFSFVELQCPELALLILTLQPGWDHGQPCQTIPNSRFCWVGILPLVPLKRSLSGFPKHPGGDTNHPHDNRSYDKALTHLRCPIKTGPNLHFQIFILQFAFPVLGAFASLRLLPIVIRKSQIANP